MTSGPWGLALGALLLSSQPLVISLVRTTVRTLIRRPRRACMGALDFLLVMHWHVTITYVTYKALHQIEPGLQGF